MPRGSTKTDWEVELAVVIGKSARYRRLRRGGAGLHRRVRRLERRVRARLPDRAVRRAVVEGQVLRDLQPARPGAGPGGRGRRPAEPRPEVLGERRAAPGLEHPGHDLLRRGPDPRPLAVHDPRARATSSTPAPRKASPCPAASRTWPPATRWSWRSRASAGRSRPSARPEPKLSPADSRVGRVTDFLDDIRTSYDTVATSYAELVQDGAPYEADVFDLFAKLAGEARCSTSAAGPAGLPACWPTRGLQVIGIDLSPGMIEVARRDHPELDFRVGSMTALDLPDGELAGVRVVVVDHPPAPRRGPAGVRRVPSRAGAPAASCCSASTSARSPPTRPPGTADCR